MDNPLTPNKIQRLMNLAEDKSFNIPPRLLLNDEDLKRLTSSQASCTTSSPMYESSSGILDLERLEGFGESGIENQSLSKSTAFYPGEMTGRSTEADEVNSKTMNLGPPNIFGRHSLVLDSITSQMDKQTSEVQDIMRHSIATNYSFYSKRDMTADEASCVMREAPLPVKPGTTSTTFSDSMEMNNSTKSAYFKNRCPEFNKILGKTDSPDRSVQCSITEVSTNATFDIGLKNSNLCKVDQTLDAVPVKQPRSPVDNKPQNFGANKNEKQINFDLAAKRQDPQCNKLTSNVEKPTFVNEMKKATPNLPSSIMGQKSFMGANASKPADILLRNLQSSLRMVTDDTEGSVENSFSISKIVDYLGKQSNVSVTDFLQMTNKAKAINRKAPLSELQMNPPDRITQDDVPVIKVIDTKNMPTASSAGSVNTVISLEKLQIGQENIKAGERLTAMDPQGDNSSDSNAQNVDLPIKRRSALSKSSSSKSPSTLSTVQENFPSFKSGDSPLHSSRGEAKTSHIPSPNIEYKELDKSVDWHEVLLQKRMNQAALAKEEWADISATSVNGFVGVSCPVNISVTTLTDSWLTANFHFDDVSNNRESLSIELPRQPFLLSPKKTEQFTIHVTSLVELKTSLPFKMLLRDASIDGELQQSSTIDVNIKMPDIQAMSCDGVNKVNFPPITENNTVTKSFVLITDSTVDLHLELSIGEGDSLFSIKNAQEVRKSDINKVLMDRCVPFEAPVRRKHKLSNIQLCRLSKENGIKVMVAFNAPKLSDLKIMDKMASFCGVLNVCLMGVKIVLRKVELVSVVGTLNLVVKFSGNNVHLTNEPTTISLLNSGTIPGVWTAKFADSSQKVPIRMSSTKFDLRPGMTKTVSLAYTDSNDIIYQNGIIFEESTTGIPTELKISAGSNKPKVFPIKTNHTILSWVRKGRKELSLKNTSNSKVHVKCQIVGAGFSIDLPGGQLSGELPYLLSFGPSECRSVPIVFNPNTHSPHSATLHIVYDRNSEVSRKVMLFGCVSGDALRWSGPVTYGDRALVCAAARAPVALHLYNKSCAPAFVCARVQFNLQYMCAAGAAHLSGGRCVVAGRARHALVLTVPWAAVERRARSPPAPAALAALAVLTGAELTRRRLLRILKDNPNGELETSLLPEHLRILAEEFEGEDKNMDLELADFKENKESLNELISGLQELTAQIDLPQDFTEENTIIICDDTVIEHHTLCD